MKRRKNMRRKKSMDKMQALIPINFISLSLRKQ